MFFCQNPSKAEDPPQGQIDARLTHAQSLGERMFVGVLQVLHDEQVPVVHGHEPFLLRGAMPDDEVPRGPEAHAGDAAGIDFGFVVAVPSHGVFPIAVVIE